MNLQATAGPLRPFRARRYTAAAGGRPGDLLSPSGDMIGAEQAAGLAAHPHAFLRLMRPDLLAPDEAEASVRAWTSDGILEHDPAPSLYVVEQRTADGVQRAVMGVMDLAHPRARGVRPHESVDPRRVRVQAERRRTAGADLEPVLLCFDGGSSSAALAGAACLEEIVAETPLLDLSSQGGGIRQWRVTGAHQLTVLERYLAHQMLCIADGHHRWAAAEQQWRADPAGPWRFLLASVVDVRRHPLASAAIHRVLPGTPLSGTCAVAQATWQLGGGGDGADDALMMHGQGCRLVWHHPGRSNDPLRVHRHTERLVTRLTERGCQVEYEHCPERAVARAEATGGTALLLPPVPFTAVLEAVAREERMPRKTTSVSPKPWGGLAVHRHVPAPRPRKVVRADRSPRVR